MNLKKEERQKGTTMFSFHKPKIYRSNLGCCICKAKSSSSRFTDSKKYENEFERCFRIQEKRSGEICNACVLLVKRWKKLSPENRLIKHWHHVVDARAGPGTKLTGNRRLTNNSPSSANNSKTNNNNNNDLSSSNLSSSAATTTSNLMSSASGSNQQQNKHHNKQYSNANNRLIDVLPLSSSQANNQATLTTLSSAGGEGSSLFSSSMSTGTPLNSTGSIRRRTGSWSSNKARAIDTNVSTFTFGEPSSRRSYMASESSYSTPSSSIYKPQSALNSGAFESVIKRFRQRQQQEQIEAKRRQLNRKQRLMQQQQQQQPQQSFKIATKTSDATQTASEKEHQNNSEKQQEDLEVPEKALPVLPNKRLKRSSESIGSLSIDGIRVSTILDNSIWRKEKICCGIVFRGLNNEIAVFPKLLKPCQARTANKKLKRNQELDVRDDEDVNTRQIQSPPPRATKSGSISSCDSNTSGTGSMEQPLDEHPLLNKQHRPQIIQKQRRKSSLKPLDIPDADMDSSIIIAKDLQIGQEKSQSRHRANIVSKRTNSIRAIADNDSTNSSSSSSAFLSSRQSVSGANQQVPDSPTASSASSSGASSSRLMLMADDDELIMDEDEEVESNTDSSIESLNEMERKKSNTKTVGALS